MIDSEILVRPPRPTGPILLLLFGLAWLVFSLFAIAACVHANEPMELFVFWILSALIGLVFCLASALWWMFELSRRRWLAITPQGFTLSHADSQNHVIDEQILSIASSWKPFHFNGSLWWSTRSLTVWVGQGAKNHAKLILVCKVKPGASDPLADLTERISGNLTAQAKIEFANGQIVYGEGWALDQQSLRITPSKKQPIEIGLAQLEAVEVIEEEICFWIEGRDEAFAKVGAQAANAFILKELVLDLVRDKMKHPPPPEDGRLGRIIFQRTPSFLSLLGDLFFGLMFLGLGIIAVITIEPSWETVLGALMFLLLGLHCWVGAYQSKTGFFRCHLFGVHRKWLFSERKIRYCDLTSFTFSAARYSHHGIFIGADYALSFESIDGEKPNRVVFKLTRRVDDSEMEKLRDQVSAILGTKMARNANQGQRVTWTNNLFLGAQGLEYHIGNVLTRKETHLIPYDDIAGYRIEDGVFSLFSHESSSPVVSESVGAGNFSPGFFALQMLKSNSLEED